MKINTISGYNYSFKNTNIPYNIKFKSAYNINTVKNIDVVKIFEDLAKIPSPPLKEKKVADWILSFCKKNRIKAFLDGYKNVIIQIKPTAKNKAPLLFSAHMDVVGDDSPVNLVKEGNFIKTDGKRTLGADDKAGIAAALALAKDVAAGNIKHGGLEMIFTRDEELGMTGINNAELDKIDSKYVLVLDEAKLGQLDNSGAGFTTATISLTTPYGGHSGMDIKDKFRLNAAKMIAEIITKIPQGVYYEDENGTITSINMGTIIAGDIQNSAAKIVEDKIISNNYLDFFMKNSVTNVINTKAMATLSIRSSGKNTEAKLKKQLSNIIDNFNKKYEGLAFADISYKELIPIFEKNDDQTIENIFIDSCKNIGLEPSIGTFPAGAETHIFTKKKNKKEENFVPSLLGVADIYNMHSPSEKMNFVSLKKGFELIKNIFLKFNEKNNCPIDG